MSKRIHWFEIGLIVLILGTAILAALRPDTSLMNWFTTDDAFYYFVVARNITEGFGVTFDRIGLANGFHPLWMLVCIPVFALARFDPILPLRLIVLILGILNAATTVLIYRLLQKAVARPIAMAGAIAWAFLPGIYYVTLRGGLESSLSAFFLAILFYATARISEGETARLRDLLLLGACGALAVLGRLDNVFIVALAGLWLVFRRSPLRYYVPLDIAITTLSILLSYILRLGQAASFLQYSKSTLVMLPVAIAVKIPLYFMFGLHQSPGRMNLVRMLRQAFLAVSISSVIVSAVMLGALALDLVAGFPRSALLIDWGLSLVFVAGLRLLLHWLAARSQPAASKPRAIWQSHWKTWLKDGAAYFGVLALALTGYMSWSYLTFGTPMPVSGQIKEWWGTLPDTVYGDPAATLPAFLGIDPDAAKGPWSLLLAPLGRSSDSLPNPMGSLFWLALAALVVFLLKINRACFPRALDKLGILPLFIGCLIQFWTYSARAYVGMRLWYWLPQSLFTILALCLAAETLLRLIRSERAVRWIQAGAALAPAGAVLFAFITLFIRLAAVPQPVNGEKWYRASIAQLESQTEPGAIIGMTGGGDTSYFVRDRTIVNLDGLINSYEYFQLLKTFEAARYLDRIGVDYIYANPYMINEADPYRQNFSDRLTLIGNIGDFSLYKFAHP